VKYKVGHMQDYMLGDCGFEKGNEVSEEFALGMARLTITEEEMSTLCSGISNDKKEWMNKRGIIVIIRKTPIGYSIRGIYRHEDKFYAIIKHVSDEEYLVTRF